MSVYTHKGKPKLTQNTGQVRAQIKDQFSNPFFGPFVSGLFYGQWLLLLGGIPSWHKPNSGKPFSFEKEKSQF